MKKILFISALIMVMQSNVSASSITGGWTKVSAGYNSNGDKVYLSMPQDLIAYLASKGASAKFVAQTWLNNCVPSNIYKGKIVEMNTIDNGEAERISIDYEWKDFGSDSNKILIIFGESSYSVKCIK